MPAPPVECEFHVPPSAVGTRVEQWLAPRLPLLSATKLRLLFTQGAIRRNGEAIPSGQRLRAADRIDVHWDPARLPPLYPEPHTLDILHQDHHLLAVNKPAGMLVHPTMGVKRGTLANAILAHWNPWLQPHHQVNPAAHPVHWPHFLHRLDRETSGVVLIARDPATASSMGALWARREVRKTYVAILEGEMPLGHFLIDAPIGRVSEQPPHWRVSPTGSPAQSECTVLATDAGHSLVLLSPITGRTN
nr:RluA family pseudouridine synthase [Bryobacterales bacterium]